MFLQVSRLVRACSFRCMHGDSSPAMPSLALIGLDPDMRALTTDRQTDRARALSLDRQRAHTLSLSLYRPAPLPGVWRGCKCGTYRGETHTWRELAVASRAPTSPPALRCWCLADVRASVALPAGGGCTCSRVVSVGLGCTRCSLVQGAPSTAFRVDGVKKAATPLETALAVGA